MSGQSSSSSSYGDTDTGAGTAETTTNTATSVIRWAPQGPALTACLIAVNIAVVALIYLYFWRFSRKRSASSDVHGEEEDASSSASTPAPSPSRNQNEQRDHDRVLASLPTFVVHAGAGEKVQTAAGECVVCIAELRNGDEARALPRCGHRFHAACVDAWLRRHTNCPLCRASVLAVGTGAGPKGGGGVTDTTASAVEDMDAPV